MPRNIGGSFIVSVRVFVLAMAAFFRSIRPVPTMTRTTATVLHERTRSPLTSRVMAMRPQTTNGAMLRLTVHHWCMKFSDAKTPSQSTAVMQAISNRSLSARRLTS